MNCTPGQICCWSRSHGSNFPSILSPLLFRPPPPFPLLHVQGGLKHYNMTLLVGILARKATISNQAGVLLKPQFPSKSFKSCSKEIFTFGMFFQRLIIFKWAKPIFHPISIPLISPLFLVARSSCWRRS